MRQIEQATFAAGIILPAWVRRQYNGNVRDGHVWMRCRIRCSSNSLDCGFGQSEPNREGPRVEVDCGLSGVQACPLVIAEPGFRRQRVVKLLGTGVLSRYRV